MKNTISIIRSVLIWSIWTTIGVIALPLAILVSMIIPKKFYNPLAHATCAILLYSSFLFPKIKYRFSGKLPFPVIFVANHVSFFDLFICGTVLPGYPRGIQLKEHFSKPFYGWAIKKFGEIPIDTSSRGSIKNSFKEAIKILDDKVRNILIMPEGQRTMDGAIGPFKSGAFFLAKKARVPVVPIVMKGLFELNNRTSFRIRPGRFDVIFLNPVDPANFENEYVMAKYIKVLMEKELAGN